MTLYRQKKQRTEYFSVALYPTLFDDFMLVRHCGKRACMRKGSREYFDTKREALLQSLDIIDRKKSEGYQIKQKSQKA
jgi:predicted DNA-binding WGR domain protein